jgi:hypothetical protein
MVSPTYPNDLTQEVDRRWQRRAKDDSMPTPRNDNLAGGGPCPSCNKPGPIAPTVSEYRGAGAIHHHWRCHACGHEWVTRAVST